MRNLYRIAFMFTIGLLSLFVGIASAELIVDQNYLFINSVRIDRTNYDYTYQVNITNNGLNAKNVIATVSSSSQYTTIIDGDVSFGDVIAGETITSSDTFTIRQNRLYAFDPTVLSWSIQFELAAQVITPEGGEIQGEGDIVLIVPGGATSEPIPVTITQLFESSLGAPIPPNTTFLGGAKVDIGDNELNDNADISMPAPAGIPDGAQVYLVKVVEYAGQRIFHLVDTAIVQDGIITSQDPAFPGITTTGDYAFLLWTAGAGWVEGQISNINSGVAVPCAVVTLSGGYWLDIADSNGFYSLPAWAGNFVVNAFDDITGDFGEKQGFMPYGGAIVVVNVEIGEIAGEIQTTLINGNFEDGLTGWNLTGAGGVVGEFGTILPYEGNNMAMISSGEGAIGESSSSLEQSFTVPTDANELSLYYNFISEEYPEYVGSSFNDVMNVTLHTPDGSREIAFEEVNTANFVPVSGIPCGSGDCTWGQTGWLRASVDVTQWAGTNDTLTLTVHDVGDTIYDTVVLLDNITLQQQLSTQLNFPVAGNEWNFTSGSAAHTEDGGYLNADDRYAFDLNIAGNLDANEPVYPVSSGRIVISDECWGFVLIEHDQPLILDDGTRLNTWYSGYMHLSNPAAVDTNVGVNDQIGIISGWGRVGEQCSSTAYTDHLHFAIYSGENVNGGLVSIDIANRLTNLAQSISDWIDWCGETALPAQDTHWWANGEFPCE